MVNVTVNFNVTIDASGNIEVFGQEPPTISNKIIASAPIPASVTEGIIEFWEPSDAIGTRKATFRAEERGIRSDIAHALNNCLGSSIDCSGAVPFNDAKYSGQSSYTTQPDFGRLALSAYAHYLFGHMAATAAITNDQDVMDAMLASPLYSESGASYTVDGSVNSEWTASSTINANLACRLVHALVTSGDANALAIAEQVLGQDSSRALDQDNNEPSPNVRQLLTFKDGDKLYVNIKILRPTISVSGLGNNSVPPNTDYPSDESGDINYALEITLRDFVTITPKVDPTSGKYWNRYEIPNMPSGLKDGSQFPYSIKFDVNISSEYPLNDFYTPNNRFLIISDTGIALSMRSSSSFSQFVPCVPGTTQEGFYLSNYNNGLIFLDNGSTVVNTYIQSYYKNNLAYYNVGKTFTFPVFDGE